MAIQELCRITRKDGRILIYVWAKEQKRFKDAPEQDVFVAWHHKEKKDGKEVTTVYQRYYHVFIGDELLDLCQSSSISSLASVSQFSFTCSQENKKHSRKQANMLIIRRCIINICISIVIKLYYQQM